MNARAATLLGCFALALLAAPFAARAQTTSTPPDFPRGRISGYMFGDWYDNLAGNPHHAYDAAGNDSAQTNIDGKNVIGRDLNGFQIRRVYFQVDNDLSIKYSSRFRLEADGKSLTSDGKIGVAVKAAYLQARSLLPRADGFFGLMSTPTWENAEEFWSYRSIEKTIGDFRGIAPSADLGAELKGFFDAQHVVGYTVMIGDGSGQKPETNRDKRTYVALPVRWRDLHLEPYVDYENIFNGKDHATYKLFAGWDLPHGAVGYEGFDQIAHKPVGTYQDAIGNSVFARWASTDQLAAFARVDFWQPDRNLVNRVDQQLWIAGLDWQAAKDIHIMPNFEAMQYVARGNAVVPPHHDLQARITLFWKFSKPQS
ncbi:MAG TPA: hypothetical protein VMH61_05090 [Candidatus Acidoferrales bacterium]|nr:hypothetical protein [Candidatus Acidoferrales bacterium]